MVNPVQWQWCESCCVLDSPLDALKAVMLEDAKWLNETTERLKSSGVVRWPVDRLIYENGH